MPKKKIGFMCTAFRDGFQSVYGARVLTEDFMPAVEAARAAGIRFFEAGGGAMFQSPYFYCNEDSFRMMDRFREVAGPDAVLQTLARGVNVVCLDSASSEVIALHARLFKKHGITAIRNFDALNDVDNLVFSGRSIAEAGLDHQVTVTMMALPPGASGAHDPAFYEATLRRILEADIPFSSVCLKDASGTSVPSVVFETLSRARKLLPEGTGLQFHTHETAGCSVLAYKAAIEAGADTIDLSLSPVSGGTCQPDVIVMWHALRGTDYDLDVDIDRIREAEAVFQDCMKDYFLPPEATRVEPLIPWSPMPGGALTANTQMLRDNDLMGRYSEMIGAMCEVVKRGGYGTSVTPVSQFYFQQAFNNVLHGPWKKIAPGYGKMVLGYFGKTPVPPDPGIVAIAQQQLELPPTTRTVLEINDADPRKSLDFYRQMLRGRGLPETEENIFIVAACGDKGLLFLEGKATLGVRKQEKAVEKPPAKEPDTRIARREACTVTVDGHPYEIRFEGETAIVNGHAYAFSLQEGAPVASPAPTVAGAEIRAPVPGLVLRILATPGQRVQAGQDLLILEAMKMEIPIKAAADGVLMSLDVRQAQKVNTGDLLARLS